MAKHLCRNSSAGIMAQPRMSKLLYRNYGRTFDVEILSPVNYGNNSVPKFTHGVDFGKTSAAEIHSRANYGTTPAAIIQNKGVFTALLRVRYAQSTSQQRRGALIQSLVAKFRHRFCHLPHILAFGILALSLTKFVCEL